MGPKKRHPMRALPSWKHPLTKLSVQRGRAGHQRKGRPCAMLCIAISLVVSQLLVIRPKENKHARSHLNDTQKDKHGREKGTETFSTPLTIKSVSNSALGFNKFWSAVQRSTHRNNGFPLSTAYYYMWSTLLLRQVQVYLFGRRSGLNTPLCVCDAARSH
jgi:hypothetical protein